MIAITSGALAPGSEPANVDTGNTRESAMRLRPIAPADLNSAQRPLYADMRTGIEASFKGFTAIGSGGALLGPWNPWLHYPKFGGPAWALVKALSASPSLEKPVREVAILVTGAKFRAAYEIYAHVRVAELGGLSEEQISTIVAGQRPTDLSRGEAVAYDVATALVAGGVLPTVTYRRSVREFGEQGTAELICLVGLYSMVAVLLNGFDELEPDLSGVIPAANAHSDAE
jgi:4-carboxymuconolactone decarboxylase